MEEVLPFLYNGKKKPPHHVSRLLLRRRARGCACVYAGACDGVCMEDSVCAVCSV
jgi:hypothetical protein